MNRRTYVIAAVVLGAFVAVAIAQQTLVVDVNLSLRTVRVRDLEGRPVRNLTADDFEIPEDGQRRPASHLSI
jgi:hypothetical protein